MLDLIIDNIIVDIKSLFSIEHECYKNSCTMSTSCCSQYEICVSKSELISIIGSVPMASRYSKHLKSDGNLENIFDEITPNLYSFDMTSNGHCAFAYVNNRRIRCSLHSSALDMEIPLYAIKPQVCLLWPLSLSLEKPAILSVDEDAYNFNCNSEKENMMSSLCPSISNIIQTVFGNNFLDKIESARNKALL